MLPGLAPTAVAFELTGSSWRNPEALLLLDLDGTAPSGDSWLMAFTRAANDWTTQTEFVFELAEEPIDPCSERLDGGFGDGRSSVAFGADQCGTEFGSSVLAVTLKTLRCRNFTCSGDDLITEADIVFNSDVTWDVYRGPLRFSAIDFERVALHELGHALGLDHEAQNTAIMQASITNLDSLQRDDINGANTLYGGEVTASTIYGVPVITPPNSTISGAIALRSLDGTLEDSDQLIAGSPIDLYEFRLAQDSELDLRLSSNQFNTVLDLLRIDSTQQAIPDFIFSNDNAPPGSNSRLEQLLPEGNYWVAVRAAAAAERGDYELSLTATARPGSFPRERLATIYGVDVEVNPNPVITAALGSDDDQLNNRYLDLYQIDVTQTVKLRFDLSSNTIDTVLLLAAINEDQSLGSLVQQNDDGGSGTNSSIVETLTPGTYWLGATSFFSQESGDYELRTSVVVD